MELNASLQLVVSKGHEMIWYRSAGCNKVQCRISFELLRADEGGREYTDICAGSRRKK